MKRTDVSIVRLIVKAAIWGATVATLAAGGTAAPATVVLVLTGIAAEIANARFARSVAVTAAKCALFVLCVAFDDSFALLAATAAFDLAFDAVPIFAALPVVVVAALVPIELWPTFVLCSAVAATTGWIARRHADSQRVHTLALDRERRSRYHLEETQRRLESTSRELIRATEHAERTRIAHAIHDDAGHRLTGVLMYLRAVRRLVESEPGKSMRMLDTAIEALTETVTSVRETVYDLRPRAPSDAAAIRRLCATFRLCPVDLSLDDVAYSRLDEGYREALLVTIQELLTNATRHSGANLLRLDIHVESDAYLRLVYKDDGVGSQIVREGLGLGGIRHRIEALGGTLALSGHSGFVVRIVLPLGIHPPRE